MIKTLYLSYKEKQIRIMIGKLLSLRLCRSSLFYCFFQAFIKAILHGSMCNNFFTLTKGKRLEKHE
jgi:hypothetical protein